jgi:hypothetical protein
VIAGLLRGVRTQPTLAAAAILLVGVPTGCGAGSGARTPLAGTATGAAKALAQNGPEIVLRYCASSAEVNKFRPATRKRGRRNGAQPQRRKSPWVVLRSFFFKGGLLVGGEQRSEEESCSWSFINWNCVMNGCE